MTETLSCATVLFFWTVVQSNLLKAVNEQQLVMHVRQEGEYLNLVEKATCDECCTAFLTVTLDGDYFNRTVHKKITPSRGVE